MEESRRKRREDSKGGTTPERMGSDDRDESVNSKKKKSKTTAEPPKTGSDDREDKPKKPHKGKKRKEIVTTPLIELGDSEILGTPKNHLKDKKRRKKVDQDALLKPKKLQKHKLRKKKQKKKVATTTEPSEIDSDDPEAQKLEKPKSLKKIVDELGNRLDEMTEIVRNLKKNSDLLEELNNYTPKEKVVDSECCFESEDADMKNRRTIFVRGFDCSFPKDEIKRTLIKHFSSCGKVSRVFIPFHCDTGSPMGFAFINMGNQDKALTLDGGYLGGMRLQVTMATTRSEYYGYTNRRGCQRCGIASMKRLVKRFYDRPRLQLPSVPSDT